MLERLVVRWKLRRCAAVGEGVRVLGRVHVHGAGEVYVGDRVTIDGRRVPVELHALRGGKIVLGDEVVMSGGASIEARERVDVGAGARLESFCKVMDSHFHRVDDERSASTASMPVTIDEGACIGAYAILLPGARVGAKAQVRGGAVVSRVVPEGTVAAGVPATVRRT